MQESKSYRLSPQQEFWFLKQNSEKHSNCQIVLEVFEAVDENLLKQAIQKVIEQDTILRTHFKYVGEDAIPLQVVGNTSSFTFNATSVSTIEEFKLQVEKIHRTPFNLEKEELLRFDVFNISETFYLVFTASGSLLDFHSLAVLAECVGDHYTAIKNQNTPEDKSIIPYLQYSEWQNNLNEGEDKDEGIAYWEGKEFLISEKSFHFDKAFGKKAVAIDTYSTTVSQDTFNKLSNSPFELEEILGTCFQVLLWKYLKQENVFFGHVFADRDFEELENTLGLLSKCLPVSSTLGKDTKLTDVCDFYEKILEENAEYATFYPFKSSPDFDFIFEHSDISSFKNIANTKNQVFKVVARKTSIDAEKLHVRTIMEEDKLVIDFHYNAASFTADEVSLLSRGYLNILNGLLESPEIPFGDIHLFSEEELISFYKTFNGKLVQEDSENSDSVITIFKKQVEHNPSATMLIVGSKCFTYKDIDNLSDNIARTILKFSESSDATTKRIAISCEENEYLISGMLGIIKAGYAYVPLDPSNPRGRTDFIIKDSGVELILTEGSLISKFEEFQVEVLDLKSINENTDHTIALTDVSSNTAVYNIYTSGTTGKPKGVMISHKSLVNYVTWLNQSLSINTSDSSVLISSFAFDLGYTSLWGTILNGGNLHLVTAAKYKDPDFMVDYIVSSKISFIKTTPSLFSLMMKSNNLSKISESNLRLVLIGGEPIRVSDLKIFSEISPKTQLVNHYGPTESTIGVIAKIIDNKYLDNLITMPSIGHPILNTDIIILDEMNRIVAPGIPGELCISGDALALGYVNKEELTNEKFIPHPYLENAKMYRSGDIAFWATNGEICLLGRKDNQVKIRGYRIELNEIQAYISSHPSISEAIVTTVDVSETSKELVVYYVVSEAVSKDELKTFLGDIFLESMIPSYLIELNKMPLNPNGKVDRKMLPNPLTYVVTENKQEPTNAFQKRLAQIWESLLGISKLGIHDNFFELGGHSLNAIQMNLKIQKEFDVKVDLETIFSNPTIEELAAVLSVRTVEKFEEIPVLEPQEYYNLSHAQMRIWVASKFEGGKKAYNVPSIFCFEGNLNEQFLEQAFLDLIYKNENLRTVFVEENDVPKQKIISANDFQFKLNKLDYREKVNKDELIRAFAEQDVNEAFHFETGPLLRATLIQIEDEKYALSFNIHHIISDGWSRGLFFGQLIELYKNHKLGMEVSLVPSPIQYKEYAAWHSNTFNLQYDFWADLYKNGVPVGTFPTDFPRPKILSFSEASIKKSISPDLFQQLTSKSKALGITLNNVMLSLYGLVVAKYAGQNEVVVGSLVSGRNHLDTEKLLGVFINFLPIKLQYDEEQSLEEYLQKSSKTLIKSYDNQDYPFDLMVDQFIEERDLSHNPFFDTMVNFHWEGDVSFIKDSIDIDSLGISIVDHDYAVKNLGNAGLDFKLDIKPQEETLNLSFSYNNNLFLQETMELFLEHFIDILQEFCSTSEKNIDQYIDTVRSQKDENAVPINLCSSFVLEPMKEVLEYWSNEFEMDLKINFTPYNQVFQQLLNTDSLLYNNNGLNVLFIRVEDWVRDLQEISNSEKITFLKNTCQEFISAFNQSRTVAFKSYIIGIVPSNENGEAGIELLETINEINEQLVDFFTNATGCYLLDIKEAASLYDADELFDLKADAVGHMPFTSDAYAAIATALCRKIRAFHDDPFKVIAVDCDNTIWGGICGEDGTEGVVINEHYQAVQQFLVDKHDQGFLIVLCSKNNEQDVWDVFTTRSEMILKAEHVIDYRINWKPKSGNVKELSKELNVGVDSFIFLDDSEFEIAEMTTNCEDVLSLLMPEDPQEFDGFLRHNWAFDRLSITHEDKNRNKMYKAEKERKKAESDSSELISDFINSMKIEVQIDNLTEPDIERVTQLTQRTNQFNLNGIRKNEGEIINSLKKETTLNWTIRVKDKFGEYGLVGFILANIESDTLYIDTFLLSCRVLGRNVEHIIGEEIELYCRKNNISTIVLNFIKTAKNKPFEDYLKNIKWEIEYKVLSSQETS